MSHAATQPNAVAGNPEPIEVDFVIPANSSAGTEVLGTIKRTGLTTLEVTRNNRLQWAPATVDSAKNYDMLVKRAGKEIRRFPKTLLTSSRNGPFFPGFPQNIGAGNIQFAIELKEDGETTAQTVTIVYLFSAAPQIVQS